MRQQNLYRLFRREWPHLVLAFRGTVAAVAALAAAVLLKLECPYWAAMTVLIVIQPTRGLLLEKCYYRLVGTAVGSLAGIPGPALGGRCPSCTFAMNNLSGTIAVC